MICGSASIALPTSKNVPFTCAASRIRMIGNVAVRLGPSSKVSATSLPVRRAVRDAAAEPVRARRLGADVGREADDRDERARCADRAVPARRGAARPRPARAGRPAGRRPRRRTRRGSPRSRGRSAGEQPRGDRAVSADEQRRIAANRRPRAATRRATITTRRRAVASRTPGDHDRDDRRECERGATIAGGEPAAPGEPERSGREPTVRRVERARRARFRQAGRMAEVIAFGSACSRR